MTHICVCKLTIIGSDNGLSPGRRQAIIWANAGILLIGPLETNFSEILIVIEAFSFQKMHFKMSSGKCRPFCLGLNVLTTWLGTQTVAPAMAAKRHTLLLFHWVKWQPRAWQLTFVSLPLHIPDRRVALFSSMGLCFVVMECHVLCNDPKMIWFEVYEIDCIRFCEIWCLSHNLQSKLIITFVMGHMTSTEPLFHDVCKQWDCVLKMMAQCKIWWRYCSLTLNQKKFIGHWTLACNAAVIEMPIKFIFLQI